MYFVDENESMKDTVLDWWNKVKDSWLTSQKRVYLFLIYSFNVFVRIERYRQLMRWRKQGFFFCQTRPSSMMVVGGKLRRRLRERRHIVLFFRVSKWYKWGWEERSRGLMRDIGLGQILICVGGSRLKRWCW